MKLFGRKGLEAEEAVQDDFELEMIDLDDADSWSKLDVAHALAQEEEHRRALERAMLEEMSRELGVQEEESDEVEYLEADGDTGTEIVNGTYLAPAYADETEDEEFFPDEDEDSEEYLSADEEEDSAEYLSADEEEDYVEYLAMEDEEEDEDADADEEEGISVWRRIGEFFGRLTLMDKIVAATGVIVLLVAGVTLSAYAGSRTQESQVAELIPVGEKLETVGIIGEDKFLAIADAKKSQLEVVEEVQETLTTQYEEEELSTEVKVEMRLTSVQKDLKIKFINTKTNKLVGNVPFEVAITDSEKKEYTKVDEDKDGIIYMTDLTPGNYTVAMVALEDMEDYTFSTSAETVKVKENIDYEKIDVADEVKDESQVDAGKEDTGGQEDIETEGVLTDTVEWVASTQTAKESKETYTAVSKSSITDPATVASADPMFLGRLLTILPGGDSNSSVSPLSVDNTTGENGSVSGNGSGGNGGGGSDSQPPAVSGVTVNPASLSLTAGQTGSLSAVLTPDGASGTVVWSSNASDIVNVDSASGVVTANKEGSAIITATVGGVTGSCSVTVSPAAPAEVKVESVSLDLTAHSMKVGESVTLKATVAPERATDKSVTFASSDSAVASVDSATGKVTGIKAGTADITVTTKDGGKTAVCRVTVTAAAVTVTSVTLDKTSHTMKTGETFTLKATVAPDTATDKTVTFTSSQTDVATVDSTGKVTALKAGATVITAKCADKTATCQITVKLSAKEDTTQKLKDNSGNQMYYLKDNQYYEATWADYYKYNTFYKKETVVSGYTYTGWQTLDGKTYFFDKNGNKVVGEQVIQGAKYNFGSDGALNSGNGVLGIDVSKWNGTINWPEVKKSGVSYVIIRCGYRGSSQGALIEDPKFKTNIQGALNAGLKVGVYFFTQAVNEVEAVEEASMVLGQIRNYKISFPVFIDVESSGGRADGLDSATRTKVINAFCQTIQNGGYRAGVYANKTWLSSKMNVSALSGYKIWLAQYNTQPTYTGRYDMWQYSDKGRISGISGNVDLNLSYMGY